MELADFGCADAAVVQSVMGAVTDGLSQPYDLILEHF